MESRTGTILHHRDGKPNLQQNRWFDDMDGDGVANWLDVDTDDDGIIGIDPTPVGVRIAAR